jgi:hypothetical protein
MAAQDTCEFTKMMMMDMPSQDGTPAQLRSGIMRSSVLMHEYIVGNGYDKGLAWCLFWRKEEERQTWLEMAPPRHVRAAACSLVREHLALELGHTHKLAALCAVTDGELERAVPCELKRQWVAARAQHRAQYKSPVPEVRMCAYGQCSAMLVAPCVLALVGVEVVQGEEGGHGEKGTKKPLLCTGCGATYCDRECQSRDMAHFEANGCKARTAKAALEKMQPKKGVTRAKSAFELNPVLPAMLRCGLRRTAFAAPALVPPFEQVAAYLVKAWEKTPVHELYARMQPGGDFDGVGMAVVGESMRMGELTALVLANKGLYMHLQAAWKQRVLELYELQITWMQWGVRAHARNELQ